MESPCRPRSTSVTFVRSRTSSRPDDIPEFKSDDEDIQVKYFVLNDGSTRSLGR